MLFFRAQSFRCWNSSQPLCAFRYLQCQHVSMLTIYRVLRAFKNCNSQLVSFAHKAFLYHSLNVLVRFFSPASCWMLMKRYPELIHGLAGAHTHTEETEDTGHWMEGGSCSSKRRYSCGMTINRLQLTSEVKSATIFISLLYFRSKCSPRLRSAAFCRHKKKTISSNYANVQAAVMATISSNLVNNRSLQRSFSLNTLSTNIQPCHVPTTISWCPMLGLDLKLWEGCNEI